ncbi:penicillin-binding protein [Actinoplanes sp. KI2]|uniref:penicillin-binding protein n=1 Tax=Actinoplanes sp. KI2 TaxID=2983315 RepID=UPI0021D59895|nr:penicillin-binding protein [Actinoplanes sp. KI2]MCU7727041.1 penicillin-binding protein [Actinoplanes sp. KI2]
MSSWFRRRDHNIFTNAASLVVCGALAGVVVAAAAFPAAAMSGLTVEAGGKAFASLPSQLKAFSSPQITRVFASDNKTQIAVMYDEFRSDVPLSQISINMQNAIIAAEDRGFYHHSGVDIKGTVRAFVNDQSGGSKQGASTLTMQYVRMALAYSATTPQQVVSATEDTAKRKITEMKYAMQVEKELTKQQILERYLNIAPFGNGAYGIFAASQIYFQKSPKDLDVAQAALLAGMVKAPTSFNPTTATGYPQAVTRRQYVLDGMVTTGAITQAQEAAAAKEQIPHKVKKTGNGCVSVSKNEWGFFCDYFTRWWLGQQAFGATTYDREQRLNDGGYRVVTTMDLKATAAAHKRITEQIGNKNKDALMLAAVQPGTGQVLALAANRTFSLDDSKNFLSSNPAKRDRKIKGTYPNTTNPIISGGGDVDGYQAGSTFKLFTMVTALKQGIPLTRTMNAGKVAQTHYIVERGSPAACPGTHFYCPGNAGESEAGVYNMWSAFGHSVNTFFVPLEEEVGAGNVVQTAEDFGIQFRASNDADLAKPGNAEQWGAFTLGVSESTPLDLANAYATLASDGKYCAPTPVKAIVTQDNEKIDVGSANCRRVVSADVARAALDAARCPVGDSAQMGSCGGGGTAPGAHGVVDHPVFGKTGTTDSSKTAALILGTTSIVVAGYLADPDWPQTSQHMSHGQVNPAVWNTVADYMRGKPSVQFPKPGDAKVAIGDMVPVPGVSCTTVADAQAELKNAGFIGVVGGQVASSCPAGTVADTRPGSMAPKNTAIVLEISLGPGGAAPPKPGTKGGKKHGPGH